MKSLQHNVHSIPNKDFTHENSRIIPQPTTNFSLSLQSAKVYRLSPIHLANVLSLARSLAPRSKAEWEPPPPPPPVRKNGYLSRAYIYIREREHEERTTTTTTTILPPLDISLTHARTRVHARESSTHHATKEEEALYLGQDISPPFLLTCCRGQWYREASRAPLLLSFSRLTTAPVVIRARASAFRGWEPGYVRLVWASG